MASGLFEFTPRSITMNDGTKSDLFEFTPRSITMNDGTKVEFQNISGMYAGLNGKQGIVRGKGQVYDTLRIEYEGGTRVFYAAPGQVKEIIG